MKMRKIFPKHTEAAEEFHKVCDRAYVYERDENGRLWKRRASQIFMMRCRTEDEEGTVYIDSSDYFYD